MTKQAVATQQEPAAPAAQSEPGQLLSAIVMLAKDASVDVNKLQALMAMQERMETRQAETEFNRAFAKMEPFLPRIKRDGTVEYKDKPAFKFARWETVDDGIRPILREHGFSLSFNTTPRQGDGGGLVITGTLMHTSGHSKSASIPLPLDSSGGKNNLQGAGSTFSYGKRYTTTMLLNIVTENEDDDGVRSGIKYIAPEQVQKLRDLIKSSKTDELRFLEYLQVAELENVIVEQYAGAVNALMTKAAKVNPL